MQFTLHFPSNIIFEEDGIKKLGEKAIEYGNKCLIVTGKKSAQKSGALDKVTESLKKANIQFVVFDKASGEPDCEIVDEVRELADKEEVKFIIGLGGGSPMDVAKAAAGLWGQNLKTVKYVNKEPFQYRGIPFVAVPTTSGTGSEVTLNSVLYNPQTGNKKSLANPKFQASLSIIDPSLTYTMSSKLTAAVGMDALTHAVESYTSLTANEVTRALAIKAIDLIIGNLMNAVKDGSSKEARKNMALGSMIAGMAFAQTGVGGAHAISHPLGAIFNIPHGVACALLLPEIINFNSKNCKDKYDEIRMAVGIKGEFSTFIREMIKEMPLPKTLLEVGYKKGSEERIVASTFDSRSIKNNPRKVEEKDVIKILESCL